jgi:hypothetical protein
METYPWRRTLCAFTNGVRTMKLLSDLFGTDYGLMSISGIIFMLGMGVFFWRFFKRKMDEDTPRVGR